MSSSESSLVTSLLSLSKNETKKPSSSTIYLQLHRSPPTHPSPASNLVTKSAFDSKTGSSKPCYVSEWWRGQSPDPSNLLEFLTSRPEYGRDVMEGLTPQGLLSPSVVDMLEMDKGGVLRGER